jgi:hypothetical protein
MIARTRTREDPASPATQPHPKQIDRERNKGHQNNGPNYGLFFIPYPHTEERGRGRVQPSHNSHSNPKVGGKREKLIKSSISLQIR